MARLAAEPASHASTVGSSVAYFDMLSTGGVVWRSIWAVVSRVARILAGVAGPPIGFGDAMVAGNDGLMELFILDSLLKFEYDGALHIVAIRGISHLLADVALRGGVCHLGSAGR